MRSKSLRFMLIFSVILSLGLFSCSGDKKKKANKGGNPAAAAPSAQSTPVGENQENAGENAPGESQATSPDETTIQVRVKKAGTIGPKKSERKFVSTGAVDSEGNEFIAHDMLSELEALKVESEELEQTEEEKSDLLVENSKEFARHIRKVDFSIHGNKAKLKVYYMTAEGLSAVHLSGQRHAGQNTIELRGHSKDSKANYVAKAQCTSADCQQVSITMDQVISNKLCLRLYMTHSTNERSEIYVHKKILETYREKGAQGHPAGRFVMYVYNTHCFLNDECRKELFHDAYFLADVDDAIHSIATRSWAVVNGASMSEVKIYTNHSVDSNNLQLSGPILKTGANYNFEFGKVGFAALGDSLKIPVNGTASDISRIELDYEDSFDGELSFKMHFKGSSEDSVLNFSIYTRK